MVVTYWFRNLLMETTLILQNTDPIIASFIALTFFPGFEGLCQIKIGKNLWFSLIFKLQHHVATTYSFSSAPAFQRIKQEAWSLLIRSHCLTLWSCARTPCSQYFQISLNKHYWQIDYKISSFSLDCWAEKRCWNYCLYTWSNDWHVSS